MITAGQCLENMVLSDKTEPDLGRQYFERKKQKQNEQPNHAVMGNYPGSSASRSQVPLNMYNRSLLVAKVCPTILDTSKHHWLETLRYRSRLIDTQHLLSADAEKDVPEPAGQVIAMNFDL
jgi:hypothetical protein